MIFGLLMSKNLPIPNFRLIGPLYYKLLADFGPNKVFCPNFQVAISQEPLGVKSFHISMISTNGAKMKKV